MNGVIIASEGMLRAQQQGKKVNWVVHSDAVKVFYQAMQRLQGKNLNQHSVFFCPTVKC